MSKIMFSLLVHEEPLVILDQLVNLFKYNPNSMVVIHFNPKFSEKEGSLHYDDLIAMLSTWDNVYLNPERLPVGKDDIIQAHISNFMYVREVAFDYFYFIASNELFLKEGAEAFVSDYDYGCEKLKKPKWHYIENLQRDKYLQAILAAVGGKEYYYSQIEGTFYSKKIMTRVSEVIFQEYDYRRQEEKYPRDEVYFSTLAVNLFPNEKRYDGCLCKIKWQGKILFTSLKTVKRIVGGQTPYYSVKRVDRKINDYLRCYIRHYVLGYDRDFQDIYPYEFRNASLFKIHCLNFYYSVKYFIRDKISKVYRFVFRKK